MSKNVYNYEEWLSGHANRKTMMEKLERSLIPYDLFSAIELVNDKQSREGYVCINDNTYHYVITYDYQCIGHDVYDAIINVTGLNNKWQNILTGYNKFKIVMNHNNIKTIYSDHEDYFQRVIEMFENDDIASLYQNRCAYINNLLARYILLRLIEEHRPELKLLRTVKSEEEGNVFVMAKSIDEKEMLMYAFSKREAMEMAHQYDGICKELTIVYFFNQDFERDGNTLGFNSGCTRVISARTFYMEMTTDTFERRILERKMLTLVSLLYNEHIEWHFSRIERVVSNPPLYGKHQKEQKKKLKEKKAKDKKASGKPWWEKIYRTLLEDALNVLNDTPKTHADIFHFLCAANMVNAYVNQCNQHGKYSERQVQRMFQAKGQIFKCLITLLKENNPNAKISISPLPAVLVNMTVEKHPFQISFRGMNNRVMDQLLNEGIAKDGKFEGFYLQPIATALYQYSYMLRWKGINI
jgi:hypothetical protein